MMLEATAGALAGAEFLTRPGVKAILDLLGRDGEAARVVGGAVRNHLLDLPIADIDIATTALPDTVIARAKAAGIHAVPTGYDHGTVTLVVDGVAHEVTTLRQDIHTDGRHAVVCFGRDFATDALRRDFTINALSVDAAGHVHDYAGGVADLAERRVRFIGDADARIAEDYLRILRFFRFSAAYGEGTLDADGLAAVLRQAAGLNRLSRERVRQETMKLFVAPAMLPVLRVMDAQGLLMPVLMRGADVGRLSRLVALEAAVALPADPLRRLMALAVESEADVARLREALRLTNAEVRRIETLLPARPDLHAHVALYRLGPALFRDAVLLTAAARRWGDWRDVYDLPDLWQPPAFELSGADVLALGVPKGPLVGEALAAAERTWIAAGFPAGKAAQMNFLRAPVARG